MKSRLSRYKLGLGASLASLGISLLSPTFARSAPVTGLSLEIGSSDGSSNSASTGSGAIGEENDLSDSNVFSLAIGLYNTVNLGANYAGTGNLLAGSYNLSEDATGSLAVGEYNTLVGLDSAIIGSFNQIDSVVSLIVGNNSTLYSSYDPGFTYGSGMFGCYNWMSDGGNSLIVGDTNALDLSSNSALIGQGLFLLGGDASTIVGKYNAEDANAPVFVVANGEDAENRSNAFVVYPNGSAKLSGVLRVQPAGDISMGDFDHEP